MAPAQGQRWLRRVALGGAAVAGLYGSLLLRPQIVFAYETPAGNVVLHSRKPLPPQAVEIAEHARERVARSPLYDPHATYDVFLCDTPLLFALFTRNDYRAGGVASGLTNNIFLRPAHVARDRLVGYSGVETPGDRTLTYFIAHEITHVMVMRRVGLIRHFRLWTWQREGYADYVAKAGVFDFPAVLRGLRTHALELDPQSSGLYLRYHLLVAYLLDHTGMSPETLLSAPIDPIPIESQLASS